MSAIIGILLADTVFGQDSSTTFWRSNKWRVWVDSDGCNLSQTNIKEILKEGETQLTVELPFAAGPANLMIYSTEYPDMTKKEDRLSLVFGDKHQPRIRVGKTVVIPFELDVFGHGVSFFMDKQYLNSALRKYTVIGLEVDQEVVDFVYLDGISEGVAELEKCVVR